ncbi:MAG TPA: hypothetical protein VJ001_15535 [Rhodocyclaceae bacterium]|nr:hypothetical protein [Rhodocyclaceae bacterium]
MIDSTLYKLFQVSAISIVVSMGVAVVIKLLVMLTARLERATSAPAMSDVPEGKICPVNFGIPEEDIAALSAAIFVAMGPHKILHIAEARSGWANEGRAAQHSSHSTHSHSAPVRTRH